ncbi:hypothetical protein [Tindallia californiensis]|uniref:Uncharacterized protein n=1 Tax=Tindallia californiensis TaxID=159292 RepID=A0A1H3LQ27_9FIRM|nr:hypothetical protein [Tindallia californiensis]SDY66104.1 hypothetical protein SAMN05192546_103301 [Tindallia californiensis]
MSAEMNHITRKDFLKKMGTTLASVSILGGVGGILTACGETSAAEVTEAKESAGVDMEPVVHPLPYKRIDPDAAAERAYKYYKEQGG